MLFHYLLFLLKGKCELFTFLPLTRCPLEEERSAPSFFPEKVDCAFPFLAVPYQGKVPEQSEGERGVIFFDKIDDRYIYRYIMRMLHSICRLRLNAKRVCSSKSMKVSCELIVYFYSSFYVKKKQKLGTLAIVSRTPQRFFACSVAFASCAAANQSSSYSQQGRRIDTPNFSISLDRIPTLDDKDRYSKHSK